MSMLQNEMHFDFSPLKRNLNETYTYRSYKTGDILLHQRDIIFIEAQKAYCNIYHTGELKYFASRNLNHLKKSLDPDYFFRLNKSSEVNLLHIQQLKKQKYHGLKSNKLLAVLSNGTEILVARRRIAEFMMRLEILINLL